MTGAVLGGRYDLQERIGRGGYGEVWRAYDAVLSRPVAVKLLYPGHVGQPEALARFHAEARYAGSLSHQNIARVYDYGESADETSPYLVMELIDGPSLSDLLASGPLDTARSMDIVAQTATGLEAAHAVGLVHRDIKPANLLLDSGGTVKITDFGIAHTIGSAPMTITGDLIGTPGYLAPERVAGAGATSASDLYALGVVAYECLSGAVPFRGTPLEVALAHQHRPLPPLPASVPPDVAAFVMHLTAKDPAERPGSAAEVALHAGLLRDGRWPGANPGPPQVSAGEARLSGSGPARRWAVLVIAVMVLAAVTGLVATSLNGSSSGSHPISVPSTPAPSSKTSPGTAAPITSIAAQPTGATSASPAAAVSRQPAAGHKKGKGHGGGAGNNGNGNNNGNGKSKGKG